ncbi:MAG: hypothetical protein MRY32_07875 [Rickettsiales bacterium]|nr:hypothetical protein [Rickettsiales bacterium]
MKRTKSSDDSTAFASLLRNHDEDVIVFARAILTNNSYTEAHLDQYLDQKDERQRWSFLKKLRQAVKSMRDEQPARKGFFRFGHTQTDQEKDGQRAETLRIELVFARQENRIILQRKKQVNRWLAYILPVFNVEKQAAQCQVMEELKSEMHVLGKELNAEGIGCFESFKREQLGNLSADPAEDLHSQGHGKTPQNH